MDGKKEGNHVAQKFTRIIFPFALSKIEMCRFLNQLISIDRNPKGTAFLLYLSSQLVEVIYWHNFYLEAYWSK